VIGDNRQMSRTATVTRSTAETRISVTVNLDGSGRFVTATGIGFFDHMLSHIAKHGVFDLEVHATGDLHIDAHHTMEDVGIATGEAFAQALGTKAGLVRAGHAYMPLDETLAFAAVDLSGRPFALVDMKLLGREVGGFEPHLLDHFIESFAFSLKAAVHVKTVSGANDHHKAEACFKALARALDAACRVDPRRGGTCRAPREHCSGPPALNVLKHPAAISCEGDVR
jgi:imidazoleglycerol-phosphate dehydratase